MRFLGRMSSFPNGLSKINFTLGKRTRKVPSITPIRSDKPQADGLFKLQFKKSFEMQKRDTVESIPSLIPVHEEPSVTPIFYKLRQNTASTAAVYLERFLSIQKLLLL